MIQAISCLFLIISLCFLNGCNKYLERGKSSNSLSSDNVFGSDQSADAAAVNIYYEMMKSLDYPNGYITRFISQYCDETKRPVVPIQEPDSPWYKCAVKPDDISLQSFWSKPYWYVYQCNNIIEHLENNAQISDSVRSRLIGESKFLRAFHYFYLINLFGDVPKITETDFRKNAEKARSYKSIIYQQIFTDLEAAVKLLPVPNTSQDAALKIGIRAGKWAAKVLEARAYLYCSDWRKAEESATAVIDSGGYLLEPVLNNVFLIKSREIILQFETVNSDFYSAEATYFIPTRPSLPLLVIRPELYNSFEAKDLRRSDWLSSITVDNRKYYYPYKYKAKSPSPVKEYNVVMRLAEAYLIRAESRAKQGNLYGPKGAATDINKIRTRAGLTPLSPGLSQLQILLAIEQERRAELFTEWGHRWFDLKRTNSNTDPTKTRAEEVLSPIKTGFNRTRLLLPIPAIERIMNPNLEQNIGYE